jgi:hypothetical protein
MRLRASAATIVNGRIGAIVLKNSIAGFGMKQWFAINVHIATNGRKETGRNSNITQIDPPLSIQRLFQHDRSSRPVPAAKAEWPQWV